MKMLSKIAATMMHIVKANADIIDIMYNLANKSPLK